jgi:hypothetical protein
MALRTEAVICDTGDFGLGRRVCTQNWNAFGQLANRPTGVYVTPKQQTRSLLLTWPPFAG